MVTAEYSRASSPARPLLFLSVSKARTTRRRVCMRHDHVVDEAALGGDEGVGEAGLVFGGALGDLVLVAQFGAIEDFGRALGAHHGDLGGGPGVVDVGADVL